MECAFIQACKLGDFEVVKHLIDNNWALRYASEKGYLEVVKYLVSKGADVQGNNNSAVRWASYYGYLEVVKYLSLIHISEPTRPY